MTGNTPGSVNGAVSVASLSSAGAGAWMGQGWFDFNSSTHLLTDSGRNTTLKAFASWSSAGLTALYTSPSASSVLKAVVGDGQGRYWLTDPGRGLIVSRCVSAGQLVWQPAYASYSFVSVSAPSSMVVDVTGGLLYFTDSTSIQRGPAYSSSACSSGSSTLFHPLVSGLTSASNLTWAGDLRSLFFLDAGAVKQLDLTRMLLVVVAGAGNFSDPTALTLTPDRTSLLVADLQPSGWSVLKRLTVSPFSLSLYALNAANSSCTGVNATYQSGTLSTACWGSIQSLYTGSGTASDQVFALEANTGRIKVIEYSTGRVWVLLGGGAASDGFSNAASQPTGWASGLATQAVFEHSMTAIVFDQSGSMGYIAEPVSHPMTHTR